jgi:hypothetical protein
MSIGTWDDAAVTDPANRATVIAALKGALTLLGAGASSLGKAEDAQHASGDLGVMLLAVRKDTASALAGADADYIPLIVDASGRLHVAPLPASETVIGRVGSSDIVVTVTPTLDTNQYASGDLLFDSTEVAAAARANGYCTILQNITIIDKDDQGAAFTLLIANAATDFGTLNDAPDPDDTEAATVIGWVSVATTDYIDLGGAKVACVRNLGLALQAGGAATSLYVAAMNGTGTPTYTASGLVIQLGFLRS